MDRSQFDFSWYEIGPENPFNKKILDVRSFTWAMISSTSDPGIAQKFNELRNSNGEEHIGINIKDQMVTPANLEYKHNGSELSGIVFKADVMEIKWDIYIYDGIFYFTRSWTGDLFYKAQADILSDKIIINEVYHKKDISGEMAVNDIHFLIMSHAAGQPFPHKIPEDMNDEMDIALYSFNHFGKLACYATYDDILDTMIKSKE